jgi:hypothetical protein
VTPGQNEKPFDVPLMLAPVMFTPESLTDTNSKP